MNKSVSSVIWFLFLLLALNVRAQDAAFTQFYANPLYLNPSLTGNTECGRIHLNYRNHWPGMGKAYTTYAMAYDQSIPAINSGFGFLVMNDRQGDGAYNRTTAAGFFSYQLQLGSETMLSFGMKAAFYQEGVNWDKLVFADMIDPITGGIMVGNETQPDQPSVFAADFASGISLGVSDSFFVGFAADHLSQPELNFYNSSNERLALKYTLHGGFNFNASTGFFGGGHVGDLLVLPSFLYMQQGDFRQLNSGIYLSKYPFVTGVWYRHSFENPDAIIFLAGLQWENFRVGYSFDASLSPIGGRSGGAHEISLAWEFCIYTESRRVIRTIKSPSF